MSLRRADTSIVPRQWTIFQVNQPATHKILQILQRCKTLRSSLVNIKNYPSQRLEKFDYIEHIFQNNIESVDIQHKERVIQDIQEPITPYLEEFWGFQRQVLESFLAITHREFQNNMLQMGRIQATQDKIKEQYLLYVKEQLVSASETFERFVEEKLKLALQYHQVLQQQLNDTLSHWNIISKTLGDDLKAFFRNVKKQRENLGPSPSSLMVPCIVLFVVFLISLVLLAVFLSSFEVYGDNQKIQELAYMWQGAGVFLLYLWIDYGLSQYCFARRINVLLGMGCHSFHSIIFYRQRYKPIMLLTLTNIYVFLFLLFLKWSQSIYVGATINILLLAYQLFQFFFGHCLVGMKQTLFFKLSCLHFNLILIPLSDIIASILVLFFSPLHNNIIFIGIIYLIATCLIFYIRLCKIAKQEQNSLYEKSFLFILIIVVQILALVFKDMLAFAIVDLLIKEATIVILISFQFSIFSNTFLLNQFVNTLKDIFCSTLNNNSSRLQRRIQEQNTYSRIIKLALILSSFCLAIFLPFAMYVQFFIKIHKYQYQAFIMFQYILWQMLQINQINHRLKHPLSCCTQITQSVALITQKPFNNNTFIDRLRDNPLEADPVFSRDEKVTEAKEFLTQQKLQQFKNKLSLIQENSRQHFLWQMAQQ